MVVGRQRKNIAISLEVEIVQKVDQRSGKLTVDYVAKILAKSSIYPYGIKVKLTSGFVGRLKTVLKKNYIGILILYTFLLLFFRLFSLNHPLLILNSLYVIPNFLAKEVMFEIAVSTFIILVLGKV